MKAAVCTEYGGPSTLRVQEFEDPEPAAGQVVIDVAAAGLNFPDLLMIQGLYQIKPEPPFAPGGEVAGTIAKVGEGVTHVRPGDRVLAVPGFGGFAEKVVVGADQAVPIPDDMDFTVAGGFAFAYATSYHALVDRGHLQQGETLLVLGAAGGVGLTAVELGYVMGANVVAAASTDEKLELCKRYGAQSGINYASEDLKERAKALGGVDVVYDPVGGSYAEPALRALRPDGRFLIIGFASGEIPRIPLNLPLIKQCELVGVAWGAWAMREPARHAANMKQLFQWYSEGRVRPHVSKTYPFARASEALEAMARREVQGKVVLTPS